MRHFLIDTDTASDDAVALVMALTYPDVQVKVSFFDIFKFFLPQSSLD